VFESSVATGKCGDGLKTYHGFWFLRFVSCSTNLVLCMCVDKQNSFFFKERINPTNYGLLLVKPVVIKW
jgi:hypothetical protein